MLPAFPFAANFAKSFLFSSACRRASSSFCFSSACLLVSASLSSAFFSSSLFCAARALRSNLALLNGWSSSLITVEEMAGNVPVFGVDCALSGLYQ